MFYVLSFCLTDANVDRICFRISLFTIEYTDFGSRKRSRASKRTCCSHEVSEESQEVPKHDRDSSENDYGKLAGF